MTNITKEEAQKLYESGNESFKEIALRCYPELEHREKTITDYGYLELGYWVNKFGGISETRPSLLDENDTNVYPTYELAELCGQIIPQLTLWRDKYNGCELEEFRGDEMVVLTYDKSTKNINFRYYGFEYLTSLDFAFKTEEIAKQFVKDHKTLLKRYYELLYV